MVVLGRGAVSDERGTPGEFAFITLIEFAFIACIVPPDGIACRLTSNPHPEI
jgi:hypothetical protein